MKQNEIKGFIIVDVKIEITGFMNVEWPMQRDKLAESGTLTRIRLTSRGLGLALGYASRIGGRRRSHGT